MKLTPATLILTGQALFGPSWQQALSDALAVNVRTMRRWQNGDFDIPDGIWTELATLCRKRGKALEEIAKQLS